MNRAGWLGFLFFIALVLLGFATLLIKNKAFSLFGEGSMMYVKFDNVKGLRPGNEVRVDGVLMGKVKEIKLSKSSGPGEPDGAIVTLSLDEPIRIYKDGTVMIESSSVLGGDMVSIRRGKKSEQYSDSSQYKDELTYFKGDVRAGLSDVGDLASDNRENLRQLIANLKDLSQSLKEGQGTVGKLLKSDELHKELVKTITDTREEIKKVGDNVTGNLTKLTNKISDKLDNAQGPAGAILNDKKMTEKLDRIITNVEDTSKNLKEITDQVKKGDGAVSRMLYDKEMGEKLKSTIDNVERASESIRNIGGKLETGEGSVGRLLQDDELYEQARNTLESIDKFFGRASRAVIEVAAGYQTMPDTDSSMTKLALNISPDEDKVIMAGGVIWNLDKTSKIRFKKQIQDGEGDSIFKPEIQLGYRARWLLDRHLFVHGGYVEGKPGGGFDFTWEDWGVFTYPIRFGVQARDAYNSVSRERIDEEIAGAHLKAYIRLPLWIRRETWIETLLSTVHLTAGIERFPHDPGWFAGVSIEWPDEDIRTLVSLIGTAR
jgi:phospholipid/cholesterol/gamma-HCH transport system substrate-binding protein